MTGKRMMSALTAALLALTLTACGPKEPEPVPTEPMPTEPAVEVIAPAEPEPTEPEPEIFVNPLTGEECAEELTRQRPIAVMLNNHKKAQPQAGNAAADVIYEIPAEGGITRMMALYQSVEGVGEIGTVRSARDYYTSLALGHDAIYLHAGGSDGAYIFIKENKMTAMDCVNGPYEGTLFWRDKARWNKAGSMEHSVMTSGETILELFPTYENLRTEVREDHAVNWNFTTEAPDAANEQAGKLTVPFSKYKTGVFVYDAESGRYLVEQYGGEYVDANTGEQVEVDNVLVLYTEADVIKGDAAGRLKVRTTGEGEGILLRGGTVEPIVWKRADQNSTLEFYRVDGTPALLSVGKTYINILDHEDVAYWE